MLIKNTQDAIDLPKTLWHMKKSFTKNARGIYKIVDEEGKSIDGLTHCMLTIGKRHPESTRFIAPLLDIIETSRHVNKNIIKILQDTHLPVIWVTNKDALTYEKTIGRNILESIATKTIVTKQYIIKMKHN